MFLPHPRVKVSIVGSLRDREVACSASDRRGSNFESCVWRTVSSQSSHHPQEVLLAQFSLYVHKGGLIHFISFYDVPRTEDVGLPTQFGLNVGPASSPLLVQCRSIVYDADPTLIHHWICCILCANTRHLLNAASLLTHSLWRIETALCNCSGARKKQITRYIDPMLMQCWAVVATLGQHYFKQNHLSSNHYLIVNVFFWTLFKDGST